MINLVLRMLTATLRGINAVIWISAVGILMYNWLERLADCSTIPYWLLSIQTASVMGLLWLIAPLARGAKKDDA